MLVLPMIEDTTGSSHIGSLNRKNCYGLGLWAGILVSARKYSRLILAETKVISFHLEVVVITKFRHDLPDIFLLDVV